MNNSGKKLFLVEMCLRYFHEWIMSVIKGDPLPFIDVEIIRAKQEWRKELEDLDEETLEGLMLKMREFFIPSLPMIFLSELLMGFRMKFECGNVIRIGMKFWHGGAYEFAKFMRYDVPGVFWFTGDIEKLDKHIQDYLLMLYVSSGARYYDWESLDPRATKVLEHLIKTLMYHISHKVVLHLGSFWRFMRGVMYSGGKETSHGDSWIMALLFYCFIVEVAHNNPSVAPLIWKLVVEGYIRVGVYGDDHLCVSVNVLRGLINPFAFAEFLARVPRMRLREAKVFDRFITEVNYDTGEIVKKGPKFLKRYFVESTIPGTAPILPYKSIHETMVNLCLKDDDSDIVRWIFSSIGQAWDTMGTNEIAYRYCKRFHDLVLQRCPFVCAREMLLDYLNNSDNSVNVNKLLRRVNITEKELLCDFPTLEELQKRHVHEPYKAAFGGTSIPFEAELDERDYCCYTDY